MIAHLRLRISTKCLIVCVCSTIFTGNNKRHAYKLIVMKRKLQFDSPISSTVARADGQR